MRVLGFAIATLVLAIPNGRGFAQPPQSAEWVMERQLRERWMHGRQKSRFTAFTSHRRAIYVDSIRDNAAGRRFVITTGRSAFGRDSTVITTDSLGRIVSYVAAQAPDRNLDPRYPGDSARMARFRRFRHVDSFTNPSLLDLVQTRSWDLVRAFPSRPAPGVRWTDTIAYEAADDGHRQTLQGRRTSWIIRDTLVDGRQMWLVRDSAQLRYAEHFPEEERTLGAAVEISRSGSGIERGVHLFDSSLGLYRWREDTATLRGEAVLRYPDGRRFRTPATYERARHWVLRDSMQYAQRVIELNAEMRRSRSGGMVGVPTALQRRLMEGEITVRDSLLREWEHTEDPNAAEEIFRTLSAWSTRDTAFARRLDSLRIRAGDTVFLYRQLARAAYTTRRPPDSSDVARMIAFMENPGLAWEFNLSRDWLYENLAQALTTWPPAIAQSRDRVACTPSACRLLAAQWRDARESRTRDVGLVTRYAIDPARWADTLLAESAPDRPLLNAAAHLARGVASTSPASSKRPLPPANSDTSAWLQWLIGEDSAYAAVRRAAAERVGRPMAEREVHFSDHHRVAVRMYAMQTGRDIVSELRRSHERANSERERYIFGLMLQGLGARQMTAEQIANEFRAGIPERARIARQALMVLFADEARAMDSAQASALLDRLIASTVDAFPLWAPGAADIGPAAIRPETHARRGRVLLMADNLPAGLIKKWRKRVEVLTAAGRAALDPREAAAIYTISPVTTVGPFVRLGVQLSERLARSGEEAPAHFAAGTTYYLMNRDGEWVIVAIESWVT